MYKQYMIFVKINDRWNGVLKGMCDYSPYIISNETPSMFSSFKKAEKFYNQLLKARAKKELKKGYMFQECCMAEINLIGENNGRYKH